MTPKLAEHPFLLVFSGTEPKVAVMSYEQFEEFWAMSQEVQELKLQLEALTRLERQVSGKQRLVPLAELVAESGITLEEVDGDVDVENDPE